MAYKLPKLPYSYNALEPYIDRKTMRIHFSKHHAGYVEKLNKALAGRNKLNKLKIEDLLTKKVKDLKLKTAVRQNGGGHANHSLYWKVMISANKFEPPEGDIAQALNSKFGSLENFKDGFSKAALGRFGSGWAWLLLDKGKLKIESTANQDSPLMKGKIPLLGIDVWEHAYYLKYQNKRADYVKAFWHIVNWSEVEKNFRKALK